MTHPVARRARLEQAPRTAVSDAALLERIALGDRAALASLAERYHARFFRVARRMLGNDEDAEDSVQVTFLKVHLHAREFVAHWRGSTWLYRILTNVCVDVWRRRGREEPTADVDTAADDGAGALERLDLQHALERLPAETRAVVVLRYLEDLSYRDIARVRGVTVNTVKTQLHRGKRSLRCHLGGDLP